ncbi:MAG: hypothetical protein HQ541_19400 [Mariniphaga sp.]|nr:hypothetical protein [Mariniphaga sp.]
MNKSLKNIIFSSAIRGIHNEMNLNPLTLRFRSSLEKDYKQYHFKYSVDFVRVALLLSMAVYVCFNILDYVVFPEKQFLFLLIRIGISTSALFIIFGLGKESFLKKHWQFWLVAMVQLAGIGIIIMIANSYQVFQQGYYVGLILVLIFNYVFCRVGFIWASVSGWLLFTIYVLTVTISFELSFQVLFMNIFFLASANFFGMAGSYFTEYQIRREFFTIQLLKNEKANFESLNKTLEEKVKERILELEKLNTELVNSNEILFKAKQELSDHKAGLEEIIKKRTNELEEKIEELERYNQLFVGREFRIKELKDKIKELESKFK